MAEAPSQSIYALMSQAIRSVPAVGKNSTAPASMGGYAFRGIEDVLTALKPIIANLGLFVVPTTLERIESERKLSGGKVQYVVDLHIQYTWYGPQGDSLVASAWGEGSDMGDKATQKAMTAAYKSMLIETFMLADVESDSERHEVPQTEGTVRRSGSQAPPAVPTLPPHQRYGPDGVTIQELPAGWLDWDACDKSHHAVREQIAMALSAHPEAERAEARKPLDEHKAAYGWPMAAEMLTAMALMAARIAPAEAPVAPPGPPQAPDPTQTPLAAQDEAPRGLSGEPPECLWCDKPILTDLERTETEDGPMHTEPCFRQSEATDSGRAFDEAITAPRMAL